MEFDNIIVKENPGLCRCCLSEGCYKELGTEYPWMDETEVYADMLLECFDISISQHIEGPNGTNRLICEVCITRLRDACNFKKQVMDCEKKFVDMIGRGEFKKVLPIEGPDMKSELNLEEDTDVVTEIEYLEEGIDFDDDKDDPTQDITVEPLPVKPKRGRPKKSSTKVEKKAKEEKPRTSKTTSKDDSTTPAANGIRRSNLSKLLSNTSVVPFKWRGKYMCYYCTESAYDYDALIKHTNSHTILDKNRAIKMLRPTVEVKLDVSDIHCKLCSENFDDLDGVIMHLSVKHNIHYNKHITVPITTYRLRDLRCVVCDKAFSFFGKLIIHANSEHPNNSFICDACNQKFNKKRDLYAHYRTRHKKGHKCDQCSMTFESLVDCSRHKRSHICTCNICFKNFKSSKQKRDHIEHQHRYDSFKCGFCFNTFSKPSFLLHSLQCTGESIKNKTELNSFSNKRTLKDIRSSLEYLFNSTTLIPFKFFRTKFRCFYCSNDFSECDDLKAHTVSQHALCDMKCKSMQLYQREETTIKVDTSSIACKECSISFKDVKSLVDHLGDEHQNNYNSDIKIFLEPYHLIQDAFPCTTCGEVFRYFRSLLLHVNQSHSHNKLICRFCGQSFKMAPNLRSHERRYHRTESYKCNKCNAVYSTMNNLHKHKTQTHCTKLHKCSSCQESFPTLYHMRKHKLKVHNLGHQCSRCGKLFTSNAYLDDHTRRIHLKEKNLQCPVCPKRFFDKRFLKTHMVKHYGERKFECDACGNKFLWKKNLRSHMTTHMKRNVLTNINPN
ncbi:zinc finger protein 197-like isoform X3 [Colias croceus]|uniref:zinc finger protein 197-like isoform X3 n=1 Tax=Colias crocea TaxID=72248 RepID=UPI001E279D89|nr:zinc finger protein 197-like isoform X3 [Colias croceus]